VSRPEAEPDAAAGVSFVHLSGPRRGDVDSVRALPATIGSAAEAAVAVPGAEPCHALVLRRGGHVLLVDHDSARGTFLAGEQVREAVLRDGDVVELGMGGPQVRLRLSGGGRGPDVMVPAAPRRMSETMALRVVQRTSHTFRRLLVAIVVLAAALFGWSYHQSRKLQAELTSLREAMARAETDRRAFAERVDAERQRAVSERTQLQQQIEEYQKQEASLRGQLADAAGGEVDSLRDELHETRARIQTLESERAAGETIIRQYGGGVALLQGAYAFYDGSNQPVRVALDENGRTARNEDGSPILEVDADGPVHTVEFYGTGFLVDRRGRMLTNRHLAEPWWNDDEAQALDKRGFKPRMLYSRAFFPGQREPFTVHLDRRAEEVDLAVLKVELRGKRVPVLPLERSKEGTVAGQPVVVVGYPAGLEALLAKTDTQVVKSILEKHGTSAEKVTEALGQSNLIRPSTTQGHIGDVTRTDIVFDAPTTQGGSGGPVFNKRGQVVAVEYAVLQKFGGNSFGVPIEYALKLLDAPSAR
jgi:S1-C subfamily serine protease